jgi:methylated-DNA-[protein]-cysteine S-methyltransferase
VSGKSTSGAEAMPARAALLATPVGRALCRLNDRDELLELKLAGNTASLPTDVRDDGRASAVQAQLDEYFAGTRKNFDLPLAPHGTEFQQRVWHELLKVPYGQTITYSELAARLGDVKAVRAVGRANGANPIWIIIPCHRVVGADGSLTRASM